MNLAFAIATALLLAACTTVPEEPPRNVGPIPGCCSADFDPNNPTASEPVPIRPIPQHERLYFQPENVENRRLAFLVGRDDGVGFGRGAYAFQDEEGWGSGWGPSGGVTTPNEKGSAEVNSDFIGLMGWAVERWGNDNPVSDPPAGFKDELSD